MYKGKEGRYEDFGDIKSFTLLYFCPLENEKLYSINIYLLTVAKVRVPATLRTPETVREAIFKLIQKRIIKKPAVSLKGIKHAHDPPFHVSRFLLHFIFSILIVFVC